MSREYASSVKVILIRSVYKHDSMLSLDQTIAVERPTIMDYDPRWSLVNLI